MPGGMPGGMPGMPGRPGGPLHKNIEEKGALCILPLPPIGIIPGPERRADESAELKKK